MEKWLRETLGQWMGGDMPDRRDPVKCECLEWMAM